MCLEELSWRRRHNEHAPPPQCNPNRGLIDDRGGRTNRRHSRKFLAAGAKTSEQTPTSSITRHFTSVAGEPSKRGPSISGEQSRRVTKPRRRRCRALGDQELPAGPLDDTTS